MHVEFRFLYNKLMHLRSTKTFLYLKTNTLEHGLRMEEIGTCDRIVLQIKVNIVISNKSKRIRRSDKYNATTKKWKKRRNKQIKCTYNGKKGRIEEHFIKLSFTIASLKF